MDKKRVVTKINKFIFKQSKLQNSLNNAQAIGTLLWVNNIGIYSLCEIEKDLSNKCYEMYSKKNVAFDIHLNKKLFVVSEPYLSGGHTRLMEKLSSFYEVKPDLLITRNTDSVVLKRMSDYFDTILSFPDASKDELDFIYQLTEKIQGYNKVILNIHPDDIHTVVACFIAKKNNPELKIFFVNHADHVFTYGQTVADVWFEISEFGRRIDVLRGLKAAKSFLGIPLDTSHQKEMLGLEKKIIRAGDIFITAGAGFKYRPIRSLSLNTLIYPLLNEIPKSKVYVIGARKYLDYWWWINKLKFGSRLILMPTLEYDDYIKLTSQAKGYIDSHPLPGGSAFAEQFFRGKICIGLTSPVQGYSPVEMLKVHKFDSKSLFSGEEQEKIYNESLLVHSYCNVKKRLLLATEYGIYSENLCEKIMCWTGNEHCLESNVISNIPCCLALKNIPYRIIFSHGGILGIIKFFLLKMARKLRRIKIAKAVKLK
ncbi:hypothetical protein EHN07_10065 [Buttiauxella warmboldiae]|uniref:Glycosyltransferase family 1 protein n=1 Tax=Buttiauxella warmboldiae TaxID=82993 RepID=A0A3N5E7U7_9ENTR|nr:hypothetical protein [Buttiauxella warmboldiae]RPH28133.1 hypothetical protein EHN07_10065 [Buttiauxella warmboldiae]